MSMIALAALAWLPAAILAAVSIAIVVLHNLLDGISAAQFRTAAPVWNILHQSGFFKLGNQSVLLAYPLIPWIAVMSLGFCFGPVFLMDPAKRRRILAMTGAV